MSMITRSFKLLSSLFLILICAGCVKSPFARPRNLKPLTKETAHDVRTKEQVTVYAKKLNNGDQQELFGKYAKQLQKFRITPVQLTVENKSELNWILEQQNIDLKKITIDRVSAKMFASRRRIPLWIFWGGVGLAIILGPVSAVACILYLVPSLFFAALVSSGITTGVPIVLGTSIAIIEGISCHRSQNEMSTYLKTCCNAEGITVEPDITASMLFFANESEIPEKLNVVLTHTDSSETLPFELAL